MANAFTEFLVGRPGQFRQGPNKFDTQQQQIISQAGQLGLQGLGTDAIEGKAREGFRKNTVPLLSERFANIGGRGLSGVGSSGYQNALQGAGNELETSLAALRQANANNLLNLGLTQQNDQYFEPGTQGVLPGLIDKAADAGLAYATGGLSALGKGGGVGNGNIMNLFQSLFGGGQQTIGGQQYSIAPARPGSPAGVNTFRSPEGTSYSGFTQPELQNLLSNQPQIGALEGGYQPELSNINNSLKSGYGQSLFQSQGQPALQSVMSGLPLGLKRLLGLA